jgi:hypothetical protein
MGRRDRCRVSQHRGRSRDASGARILGSRSLRRTACVRFQSHVGCRIRGTADAGDTESRTCLTRDRPPPVCVPRLRPLIRPSSLRCRSAVRNPMVEIVSESRIRATRTSRPRCRFCGIYCTAWPTGYGILARSSFSRRWARFTVRRSSAISFVCPFTSCWSSAVRFSCASSRLPTSSSRFPTS